MDSVNCRLDQYVYICMLYVYVYVIVMHVCICYIECMLCLFAMRCSKHVLYHIGDSSFHKTRLGIVKTCLK